MKLPRHETKHDELYERLFTEQVRISDYVLTSSGT